VTRALVIVPTLNERQNLPPLVDALLTLPNVQVLVVDDNSPDGTGAVADELAAKYCGRVDVMHRTDRRGLGRSYVDGMQRAIHADVDVICQMDADFSHDPLELPRLIEAAARADLVVGARYVPGGRVVHWPLRRQILSRFANLYVHLVAGLRTRDCTSGYRCWRREALAKVPLDRTNSEGYSFLVEMLFAAAALGLRFAEVPITFVERRQGESKLSKAVLIESVITPWRLAASREMARPTTR
jgi:dolichol-phosphate mannosyltransferase